MGEEQLETIFFRITNVTEKAEVFETNADESKKRKLRW
jgi:hypothetical protein